MTESLTDLNGVLVVLGNSAPTVSELAPCTEDEANEAGPLGRKTVLSDGSTLYARLVQIPAPGIKESYTRFSYQGNIEPTRDPRTGEVIAGDDYGYSKWLADIKLAFTRQHSLQKPSWVWSNHPAVAQLVALEFGCPVREDNQFEVVYDSPSSDPAPADAV